MPPEGRPAPGLQEGLDEMRTKRETRRRTIGHPAFWVFCALAGLLPAVASAQVEEELRYRWHLGGYKGVLARLIVPGSGDAVLRTTLRDAGGRLNELHITSPDSRRGEFWLYASEVEDADCARMTSARTEQLFRGRAKERQAEIDQDGVLDIPSTICRLRQSPPEHELVTRIWSDGRIYPVRISGPSAGEERVDGSPVATRTYTVSGLRRPDERVWKGRLELVLADNAERTPLEIALTQPGLSVRLRLEER